MQSSARTPAHRDEKKNKKGSTRGSSEQQQQQQRRDSTPLDQKAQRHRHRCMTSHSSQHEGAHTLILAARTGAAERDRKEAERGEKEGATEEGRHRQRDETSMQLRRWRQGGAGRGERGGVQMSCGVAGENSAKGVRAPRGEE